MLRDRLLVCATTGLLLLAAGCGGGAGTDPGPGGGFTGGSFTGGGSTGGGAGGSFSGRVVFASDRDGNSEIYLMDSAGERNLTRNPADDRDPRFSPDGSRIVFVSDRLDGNFDVYVMNADGTGVGRLTSTPLVDEAQPVFSPDGTRIAFVCGNAVPKICAMNSDGTDPYTVSDGQGAYRDPAFSPDGTKIVAASPTRDDFSREGLFLMYANGTGLAVRLTDDAPVDSEPVFEPDGATIVYSADGKLYRASADGTGATRVTSAPAADTEQAPAISADGATIAYHGRDGSSVGDDIFVVNADGSGRTRLTTAQGNDTRPDLPGGSGVPFVCEPDATPGALDTCFNTSGMVVTRASAATAHDAARALVIQPDGKLVVAGQANGLGDFVLVRYNPDGSRDTSFGPDGTGIVRTSIGDNDFAYALARQPDGKLVVAGRTGNSAGTSHAWALVRYLANGVVDTTFGTNGVVLTTVAAATNPQGAYALAVQPDGKLVAAGDVFGSLVLARFEGNGTLDTSFDGDGLASVPGFSVGPDYSGTEAASLVLQADGKLVVGGRHGGYLAVARVNPDGSPDTTFDGDGVVSTPVGSEFYSYAAGVAVQADGKVVAAGYAFAGDGRYDFAVVRYNPDGALDTTFDGDGMVMTAVGERNDEARAVAIQADGKIVVAGFSESGAASSPFTGPDEFALARYNTDGSLDGTFGAGGIVRTFVRESYDRAYAVAIQPGDGKLVVAGSAMDDTSQDVALARYMP